MGLPMMRPSIIFQFARIPVENYSYVELERVMGIFLISRGQVLARSAPGTQ